MAPRDPDGTDHVPTDPVGATSGALTVAQAWPGRPSGRFSPGEEVGPYRLLNRIARGGLGDVYRAEHRATGAVVALKVVRAADDDSVERRSFDREIEAARRLSHRNLLPILDAGEHDGLPYFAMPYIPGGSLESCVRDGPMPPRRAARLIALVARAVHYAHQRGVLHRDLKPANILLGAGDEPLVADFGLARFLDHLTCHTRPGQVLGSVPYMAPEQAAGQAHRAGPATDVWALGVILYELLAGHRPFRAATQTAVLRLIECAAPAPLRDRHPEMPPELEAICRRCLAKSPANRYPSARHLADDLQSWLDGCPLAAAPSTRTGPLVRVVGRRAPAVSLLGTAAVALAVGLALVRERPAPPPPDPAEQARLALRRATPGQRVALIEPGRRPRWSSFETGGGLSKAAFPPRHGALIDSRWFGLFELLPPDPKRGDYRLHVEMTRVEGERLSYFGLYAGRRPFAHPGGRGHTMLLGMFDNFSAGQLELGLLSLCEQAGGFTKNHRIRALRRVALESAPFRFALEVRGGEARVVSGGREAGARRAQLVAWARTHQLLLPELKGHQPDLAPTGGAGIILFRGLVRLDRVVYEPLAPIR